MRPVCFIVAVAAAVPIATGCIGAQTNGLELSSNEVTVSFSQGRVEEPVNLALGAFRCTGGVCKWHIVDYPAESNPADGGRMAQLGGLLTRVLTEQHDVRAVKVHFDDDALREHLDHGMPGSAGELCRALKASGCRGTLLFCGLQSNEAFGLFRTCGKLRILLQLWDVESADVVYQADQSIQKQSFGWRMCFHTTDAGFSKEGQKALEILAAKMIERSPLAVRHVAGDVGKAGA